MTIVDIINKKRLGKVLTREELEFAFLGFYHGDIPDYQMSSLLMAICLKGMTDEEILELTDIFIKSGSISKIRIDNKFSFINFFLSYDFSYKVFLKNIL